MNWGHSWCLPGTPDVKFLPDERFRGVGKKAQGITTEISAWVFACGFKALQRAFGFTGARGKHLEGEGQKEKITDLSRVMRRRLY